jgi:hypothetical protein
MAPNPATVLRPAFAKALPEGDGGKEKGQRQQACDRAERFEEGFLSIPLYITNASIARDTASDWLTFVRDRPEVFGLKKWEKTKES